LVLSFEGRVDDDEESAEEEEAEDGGEGEDGESVLDVRRA
jgi:hypothetical protein